MVTAKQIKAIMNSYLKGLPRHIDRCENNEDQEMEVAFLQSLSGSLSLFEWLNRFSDNYAAENHIVCLWIINQGYISAIVDVFTEYERGLAENEELLSDPGISDQDKELLRFAIQEAESPYHSLLQLKCEKNPLGQITLCGGRYKLVKGILSEA